MSATGATTLIHDGRHLQALVREGSSPYVLVTFNGRGFRADGERIWAQPVIEKLDLNAVGFVTKESNWFPEADFTAALAAARPFLARFDERIGYGYSQGGYAAIKASRPLGLTRTIAVSPQWSIDPADIIDDRYNRFFDAQTNRAMAITGDDAPSALILLYDAALAIDHEHVSHILAAAQDATVVRVPFTSHETVRAIQGTEAFKTLVESLGDGSTAATVSRLRRASAIRNETMIERALAKKQFTRASAILAVSALGQKARTATFMRFAREGGGREILDDAAQHAADHPRDAMAQVVSAYVLVRSGKPRRAREAATRALDLAKGRRARQLAERILARCDRAAAGDGRARRDDAPAD